MRRATQRLWRSGIYFGLIGVVAVADGALQPLSAQDVTSRQLALDPRKAATGPRTERAGESQLSLPSIPGPIPEDLEDVVGASVYVPPQCVGTRRCPLLVFAWLPWTESMTWVRPAADKYGFILLGPGVGLRSLAYNPASENGIYQRAYLDATLREVLRNFAIDPARIAIMGTCATGAVPVLIGGDNFHLFSRIISLSGAPPSVDEVDPPNPMTEFFFDAGVDESSQYFRLAQDMRRKGYRVTHAFGFRWHGHTLESYDHVGRWLQESWAVPDPAARSIAAGIADPPPELTLDALAKMTAFWTHFVEEPDSIRMVARREHLRAVTVPVGTERPMVMMTDMAALAATYPSVAAALKAAGLTAQEHDAYRAALASARAIKNSGEADVIGTLDSTSIQAKNVIFMDEHQDELQALEAVSNGYVRDDGQAHVVANMWTMP